MDRYLFRDFLGIEGFDVAWYGVITIAGIVAGVILALFRLRQRGLRAELLVDALLGILPLSFIGARLYYVAFRWEQYRGSLYKIAAIWEGGQAMYGSFLGGLAGAYLFSVLRKFSFLRIVDLLIPSLLTGQIIGRWGNYVNQEAYGRLITDPRLCFFPYGVYIDRMGAWYQAAFFYESMWNLMVLVLILILERKYREEGCTLAMYLMGYGAGRFWIEGLRSDSLYLTGGVRASQLLSGMLVLLGALLFARSRKRRERKQDTDRYNIA